MTRHETPPPDQPACGMPSAVPEITGALVGAVIGLVADWLLWRWVTRAFRS